MITDYRVVQSRTEWCDILALFNKKDIYFEYDYFDLYSCEGESPVIVYMDSTLGKMAYPFMMRDISYHPSFSGKLPRGEYFDISTPYGYSGHLVQPYSDDDSVDLIELFYSKFESFCHDHNVVSEFVKFSPLLKTHRDMDTVLESSFFKKMVATNLQDYDDPIYGEVKKHKRKDIHKCKRLGLYTVFEFAPSSFDSQLDIYYDTMERKNASDFYLFSKEYFQKMLQSLSKHIMLVSVYLEDRIIGFELCFIYDKFIYGHLSGTDRAYLKYSPHDLSSSDIINWGYLNGYSYFFTGGGLSQSEEDSLYAYKKSFAKNSSFDLYLGKKIWNNDAYDYLVSLSGQNRLERSDFFPKYRVY